MNALRTLTLSDCLGLPFIPALNPNRIPYKAVVCPKLDEFVLYISTRDQLCINELLGMAKERRSRGAKLMAIRVVCPQEFVLAKEVLKLRGHVTSVEYRLDDVGGFQWYKIPGSGVYW
jgi:hypothetical protein